MVALFNSKKELSSDNMENYVFSLEQQLNSLETEKQVFAARTSQLELEVQNLKKQLKDLMKPAFLVCPVIELLPENRAIVRNSNGLEFLVEFKPELRKGIEIGSRLALNQRTLSVIEVLSEGKSAEVSAFEVIEKPKVTLNDIGGLNEEIQELEEVVILPLLFPEKFIEMGIDLPTGILLHGAPGTGKTLLAKAIANKTYATFISLTGSQLVKKFIGEGARMVREVFKLAKQKKPAIIFIDELDAVGTARNDSVTGDREVQRTLMQLLAEMDGFHKKEGIVLMAATNRMDIIDPALLRPGRFDRLIEIPFPSEDARQKIFEIHSKKMKLDEDVILPEMASLTSNFSGADIKAVCTEAAITAIRENKKSISHNNFIQAINKIKKEETSSLNETKMFS
jgi:proteasome regulatory subunit